MVRPSAGPVSGDGYFGWRRLAGEGPTFHSGLDFVGATGSAVRAAKSGIVLEAAPNGVHSGYGNVVIVKHDDPTEAPLSLYAHLHTIARGIRKGRRIKAGRILGGMGNTAATFENRNRRVLTHLHFELLRRWPAAPDVGRVDPTPFLFPTPAQLSTMARGGPPLLYPSYPGAPFSGLSDLPSADAAKDLIAGVPGSLLRVAGWTTLRAALIGSGLALAGQHRRDVVRGAVIAALVVEAWILLWAMGGSDQASTG